MASHLWQEAFDEASQCMYYYHIETGETAWTLPVEDEDTEAESDLSFMTFAVVRLQAHFRGHRSRRRVARLVRARYQTTDDPTTQQTLYTDRRSGESSWSPPALFLRLGLDRTNTQHGDDDDDDEEDEDFDLDAFQEDHAGDDSGDGDFVNANNPDARDSDVDENDDDDLTAKNKKRRQQPRSAAQLRVDTAEDDPAGAAVLDMSRLNAWKLSRRIWNLATLTQLSLAHNQLTRIPSGLQDLVRLEHLDLSYNHLTRLPSCLQTTMTLKVLDASHNRITAFSPRLWKLRGLEELRLGWNALQELPFVEGDLKLLRDTREWQVGVGLLRVLRVLDLQHNRLRCVPTSIEKCSSLRVLDLSHNKLTELTDAMCEIETLVDLRVSRNALSQLPEAIGALANLTTLTVDANRLTALPESIGNLHNLAEIDLRRNQLHHLPEAFGALGQLRHVHLDGNPSLASLALCLRFLPSVEGFSAVGCGLVAFDSTDFLCKAPVTRLCLSENALLDFPVNLNRSAMKKTLTELVLAKNSLQGFPVEIVSAPCEMLVTLDLSHNRIRSVPSDIVNLRALRSLILSHNALGPSLPEAVAWLPQLVELRCDHNKLQTLPMAIGILKKLQHVDVAFNALTSLPTSFMDLVGSLRSLKVNSNQLATAPPVAALLSPRCFVDLSNNPFCQVTLSGSGDACVEPQRLHAAAIKLFHDHEYEAAETLLTQSLGVLDVEHGVGGWRERTQHVPAHLYLRGLCRYMVMKHARVVVNETSQAIDEYEMRLEGERLMRQRLRHRESKLVRRASEASTSQPTDDERPETEDPVATKSTASKGTADTSTSNQQDGDATWERLREAQKRRADARTRGAVAVGGALADLDRAIRLGVAEQATAYVVQGHLFMETLEFASAIESFTHALDRVVPTASSSLPQTSVSILTARAEAYRRLGQLPAALADVQRIVESHAAAVAPDHVVATAQQLAREWDVQQSQYFVDHESLFRAFDVEASSGLARRSEVHDLHAVLTATQRQELTSKTPTQRFNDSVARLVDEMNHATQAAREELQARYDQKALVLTRARDFKREIRENLVMEMEEHTQRRVAAELERLAELKRQEMDREFNERMFLKYEDEYMKWLVSEEQRLETERLRREDEARRKAEAKAQYEMRLARRGGRRQQLASRGTPGRKTSAVGSPPGTRSGSPPKGSRY